MIRAVATGVVAMVLSGSFALASDDPDRASPLTLSAEPQRLVDMPAANDDEWQFAVSLGLWAMSLDGTVGVGRAEADVSMDFSDIVENLNFGVMPGIEVGKDRWLLAFNGVFAQLESSESFSETLPLGRVIEGGADITVDMYMADLAVGYRALDIPLGEDDMVLSLTPAVGIRYTYLSVEIDPDRFASRSDNVDWWDPYAGGRVNLQITDTLGWRTDASVGGFGVGTEFTWAIQSLLDWRFSRNWMLSAGYRALYQDYDKSDFKWDVTMQGPWLGISYLWQ